MSYNPREKVKPHRKIRTKINNIRKLIINRKKISEQSKKTLQNKEKKQI